MINNIFVLLNETIFKPTFYIYFFILYVIFVSYNATDIELLTFKNFIIMFIGMGMFEQATRGTVGILYYNEKGENIQVTNKTITSQAIVNYNNDRVNSIENALKHDKIIKYTDNNFTNTFINIKKIVHNMKNKSFPEMQTLHKDLENLLWNELQCNPEYNCSISFIFMKQILTSPMTEKEAIFTKAFQSKLNDNYLYDLDKKRDFKEIYSAWIHAGKEIDPYFVDKLNYLHKNGITLTNDVLLVMKEITKNAVH